MSQPGTEAPDCGDTLRKWRCLGDPSDFSLIDIKKAYLQVHVAPELQKYQVVLWAGRTYVMMRMGFGLSVAPKLMDVVIRWITQRFSQVDNYVDDIVTPTTTASAVAGRLAEFVQPNHLNHSPCCELLACSSVLTLMVKSGGVAETTLI